MKNAVRDIKPLLKRIMGIDEDPFEDYRKVGGYQTKFKLYDRRYGSNT